MAVTTVAFADLDTWLQAQPANTASTPYEINITGLTAADLGPSYYAGTLGWLLFYTRDKYVDLSETEIPNEVIELYYSFVECSSLVKAPIIPSSVTSMEGAFINCSSLIQAPVIPNGVTRLTNTFAECTSLTQAPVIPNGVIVLSGTFSGCTSLTQAPVIPNGVEYLAATFQECTSLTQAPTIPSSVTQLRETFLGCTSLVQTPVISSGVTVLDHTFRGCSSLTQVSVIPSSVQSLNGTFRDCSSLTQAPIIPDSVYYLEETFMGCTSLTEVPELPSRIRYASSAFSGCTNLTTFKRQTANFSNIISYSDIFKGCTSLTNFLSDRPYEFKDWLNTIQTASIDNFPNDIASCTFGLYSAPNAAEIPFSLLNNELATLAANTANTPYKIKVTGLTTADIGESYTQGTFGYVLKSNNTKYVDLSETVLPNGITSLAYSFQSCPITKLPAIPNGVTNLRSAFNGNRCLTEAPVIPEGVTNMYCTFALCDLLTEAPVIPSSVTDMEGTFTQCYALTEAPVIPNGVTNMRTTFTDCTNLRRVPNVPSSVSNLSSAFTLCPALEEISLFEVSGSVLENNAQNCFYGCTSLTKIGVSENISEDDWHVYKLKIGSNTVEGKVFDRQGTATAIAQTSVNKSDLKLPFKTDELWFPNGQTDAEIESIIRKAINYKYSWFKKECLPPDQENFVLWAKDPNSILTNLSGLGTLYADMPVGTVIPYMGKLETIPTGFLYCDATVRRKADWPELWNVLPDVLKDIVNETFTLDLRECTLVGVGQSANDYDATTNPTGIQTHDVYTLGEFKDDQFQGHHHNSECYISMRSGSVDAIDTLIKTGGWVNYLSRVLDPTTDNVNGTPRTGSTTHGKQTGVAYIIKAKQVGVPHDIIANVDALVNQLITQKLNDQDELNGWEVIHSQTDTTTQVSFTAAYDGFINADIPMATSNLHSILISVNGLEFISSEHNGLGRPFVSANYKKGDTVVVAGYRDSAQVSYFNVRTNEFRKRDYSTPTLIYRETISTNSVAISSSEQLVENGQYTVMFTRDISAPDGVTPLTVTFNHSAPITVKASQDGSLVNVYGKEVAASTYKYLQAYTTLELMYDGTNFVILGNPVVLSSSDYKIYADGFYEIKKFTSTEGLWTGRFDANGKPIYKQVVDSLSVTLQTASWQNITTAPSDIDKVCSLHILGDDASGVDVQIPVIAGCNQNKTNIQYFNVQGANYGGTINKIDLEYTKTTDTAGTIPPFVVP